MYYTQVNGLTVYVMPLNLYVVLLGLMSLVQYFYLSDKDEDEHEPEQPQEEPAVMETHSLMRSASHSKTAHISRLLLEEPRHSQMPLVSRLRLEGSSAVSYSKMPLISRLLLEGPSTVIHS